MCHAPEKSSVCYKAGKNRRTYCVRTEIDTLFVCQSKTSVITEVFDLQKKNRYTPCIENYDITYMTLEFEKTFENKVERQAEQRESKEAEKDPELLAAASMERADLLVREVKSSKQQMQNIAVNIASVKKTIQQLRAQLQLATLDNDDDPASIKQDKKAMEELQKKIAYHYDELLKMRDELITEQMKEIQNKMPHLSVGDQQIQAQELVDQLLESAKE